MTHFIATMIDAVNGGDNRYVFEGPEDLMERTPSRIVSEFMAYVRQTLLPKLMSDYELDLARSNRDRSVVTSLGSLHLANGGDLPFLLMIARA